MTGRERSESTDPPSGPRGSGAACLAARLATVAGIRAVAGGPGRTGPQYHRTTVAPPVDRAGGRVALGGTTRRGAPPGAAVRTARTGTTTGETTWRSRRSTRPPARRSRA